MTKILSISATDKAEKIFNEFKRIQPERDSFSGSLALVVQDYMATKRGEPILTHPNIHADIDEWKSFIRKSSVEDKKRLHKRLWQLTNITERELGYD